MLDNYKRGKRAIFWMKVFFFIVLFIIVMMFYMSHAGNLSFIDENGFSFSALMMSGIVLLPIACVLLIFSVIVHVVTWLSWLFHAEENLRKVGTTRFSPWGSVILSFIPYIGLPLHYFIFRDIVAKTEKILEKRGLLRTDSKPEKGVPMAFVHAFALFSVLTSLFIYIQKDVGMVWGCLLGLAALACYIRVLTVFVREEHILFDLHQEDILRAKVDQVLREREIERAASEIQQAKYEP